MLRLFNLLGRRARGGQQPGESFASILDKRLAGGGSELPQSGVGNAANVEIQILHRPQPPGFSTTLRPKIVGWGRVPGWHVDAVGHMADWHLVLRPSYKQRLKEMPADFPMQAAYTIHRTAPTKCQIRHIERLRRFVRV